MTWLATVVVTALGAAAVALALSRCLRELDPLRLAFGRYRAEVQPALVRVRDETAVARERLTRHAGA